MTEFQLTHRKRRPCERVLWRARWIGAMPTNNSSRRLAHESGRAIRCDAVATTTRTARGSLAGKAALQSTAPNGSGNDDTAGGPGLEELIARNRRSAATKGKEHAETNSPGVQSARGGHGQQEKATTQLRPIQQLVPPHRTPVKPFHLSPAGLPTNPAASLHRDGCDSARGPTLSPKFTPSPPFHWSQAAVFSLIGLRSKTPSSISHLLHI